MSESYQPCTDSKIRQFLQNVSSRNTLVETYPPAEGDGGKITHEYLCDRVAVLDGIIGEARELLEEMQ